MKFLAADKRLLNRIEESGITSAVGADIYDSLKVTRYHDWAARGIRRRIVFDEPEEIVRFAMLGARSCWQLFAESPKKPSVESEELYLWFHLLWAMAVNDFDLIDHMVTHAPSELDVTAGMNLQSFHLLTFALARSDLQAAKEPATTLATRARTTKTLASDQSSLVRCMNAIVDDSPEDFAAGMEEMCKSIRRCRTSDPNYKLVYPVLHGVWSLAYRNQPTVVEAWDITHSLPWDAELHLWQLTGQSAIDTCDRSKLSTRDWERLRLPTAEHNGV